MLFVCYVRYTVSTERWWWRWVSPSSPSPSSTTGSSLLWQTRRSGDKKNSNRQGWIFFYYRRSGTRQDKENTLAIILVSIVMVFFTCHSLKFFLVLYKVSLNTELIPPSHLIPRSMSLPRLCTATPWDWAHTTPSGCTPCHISTTSC